MARDSGGVRRGRKWTGCRRLLLLRRSRGYPALLGFRSTCRYRVGLYHFPVRQRGPQAGYIPAVFGGLFWAVLSASPNRTRIDVMSMTSTAEDNGDDWLLNGSKTWISNADVADVLIYYAYTDKSQGSKGLSAFVMSRQPTRPSRPSGRSSSKKRAVAPAGGRLAPGTVHGARDVGCGPEPQGSVKVASGTP